MKKNSDLELNEPIKKAFDIYFNSNNTNNYNYEINKLVINNNNINKKRSFNENKKFFESKLKMLLKKKFITSSSN